MQPRAPVLLLAGIALVAMLAWFLHAESRGDRDTGAGTHAQAEARATAATDAGSPRTAQAQAYIGRLRFEERARSFPKRASRMGLVERSEEARLLEQELDERERRGEVSAGESMLLRAALIDATAADDADRVRRSAELVARYREDADRRKAAWTQQLAADPSFGDYKARERAVVAEVMAMQEVPGGIDRDAYLRQRLQQEREAAWPPTSQR